MNVKADDIERLLIAEELDRRRARISFPAFYMRMTGFRAPPHMGLILRLCQAMEEDLVDRAMIFAPPRHAKTLISSTLFPAWIMGRYPRVPLMSVVHTQHFAKKVGRNVRNMLRMPEWPFCTDDEDDGRRFENVQLVDDSQAKEQWGTVQGGEYNGFGAVGGNQHGNPAEWLFMDDLVKGRKIAMSPHMRDEIWETYKTDLLSRLQGRAKQLMVFTRWHMDDPAGRILPDDYDGSTGWYEDKETGERWYVLSLPAVAFHENDPLGREPGQWLWPDKFGEAKLGGMKKRGGFIWSALYQQVPSPQEGLMFQADHISRYDPQALDLTEMQVYGASDYAVTEDGEGNNPDWTVHMVWAVDPERNVYLLDLWRGRTTPDKWVAAWIRMVKRHKPLRWFEENGQIIKSVGPLIKTAMLDEKVFTDRVQMNSSVDKATRAQALLGLAAMGKVFLPHRHKVTPTQLVALDAFETELLTFPGGVKDDTVDTASLFARGLDKVVVGQRNKKRKVSPHGYTMDDLWDDYQDDER